MRTSELYREALDTLRAYWPFFCAFFRDPGRAFASLSLPPADVVRRGFAFFSIGLAIAIVVSRVSVVMLPVDERSFYERHLNVGRLQLQMLLFLIVFSVLVYFCFKLAGGTGLYAETFVALLYIYACIWPAFSLVSLLFSRILSVLLSNPVVLIPPVVIRSLEPIDPTPRNKVILAAALTFITLEALYISYVYLAVLRTMHPLPALRAGAALVGSIVLAYLLIPPLQSLATVLCEWIDPICEFLT